MLETRDLILDKAKFSDWSAMYENVWSHDESARYMQWSITESEEDAKSRILRTIDFQKTHDTYLVYEKASEQAIGFAGIERMTPDKFSEEGICLGPDFVGKGYGRQILRCLMEYSRGLGAKEFVYLTREENRASKCLAESFGFVLAGSEERIDEKTGQPYVMLTYSREL